MKKNRLIYFMTFIGAFLMLNTSCKKDDPKPNYDEVSNITLTGNSQMGMSISWDAVEGAKSYMVSINGEADSDLPITGMPYTIEADVQQGDEVKVAAFSDPNTTELIAVGIITFGDDESDDESDDDPANGSIKNGTYTYDDGSGIMDYITLWDDNTGEIGTVIESEDGKSLSFTYEIRSWEKDVNGQLKVIYLIDASGPQEGSDTYDFTSTTLTDSEQGERVYTLSETLTNEKIVLADDKILGSWKSTSGESYRLLKNEKDEFLDMWKGIYDDGSGNTSEFTWEQSVSEHIFRIFMEDGYIELITIEPGTENTEMPRLHDVTNHTTYQRQPEATNPTLKRAQIKSPETGEFTDLAGFTEEAPAVFQRDEEIVLQVDASMYGEIITEGATDYTGYLKWKVYKNDGSLVPKEADLDSDSDDQGVRLEFVGETDSSLEVSFTPENTGEYEIELTLQDVNYPGPGTYDQVIGYITVE